MELEITTPSDGILCIKVRGRMDVMGSRQVKLIWTDRADIAKYVIDLSEVNLLDSMGLATLVSGMKVARSRGGDFIIANPSPIVRNMLDLTRMNLALTTAPDVESAVVLLTAG